MNRTFKEVPSFTEKWHSLGLTADKERKVLKKLVELLKEE